MLQPSLERVIPKYLSYSLPAVIHSFKSLLWHCRWTNHYFVRAGLYSLYALTVSVSLLVRSCSLLLVPAIWSKLSTKHKMHEPPTSGSGGVMAMKGFLRDVFRKRCWTVQKTWDIFDGCTILYENKFPFGYQVVLASLNSCTSLQWLKLGRLWCWAFVSYAKPLMPDSVNKAVIQILLVL